MINTSAFETQVDLIQYSTKCCRIFAVHMHLINIFWSNVYPILNTNNFPDIRNIVNQKQNVLDDKKKCAPPLHVHAILKT